MKILLDTHIALWATLKTDALSARAKELLLSSGSEVFYSVISIWEVSLKHSINPENMEITASEFRQLCQDSGFIEIPLEYHHILGLDRLTQKEGFPVHKDPFDRLLLAQSITEQMDFMTHDAKISTFDTSNIIEV
jgi:PIN domain nuclease of toxin-antitoxin system